MKITSEDIRAIQRKLDSLKKTRKATSAKLPSTPKPRNTDDKLESDVFDSEKFFDED